MSERGRPVYSTEKGRLCPSCGEAAGACRCDRPAAAGLPAGPLVAKLRLETRGRAGKSVTVIDGLPDDASLLAELAGALKRALGTGGAVREHGVELQGDRRDRVRELLAARGMRVKG